MFILATQYVFFKGFVVNDLENFRLIFQFTAQYYVKNVNDT